MFTILPVRAPGAVDEELASRALRWLPAVGLLLSAPAAVALLAAGGEQAAPLRRLLGAALAVAVLGVLTGGLHLDGLADTADGLASRRPREQALEIMRRGDTGPLGVAALLFTVLLQVTALAALPGRLAGAGLVLAAVTARTAVLVATGPAFPAARPGGFGALVAGRTPARVCRGRRHRRLWRWPRSAAGWPGGPRSPPAAGRGRGRPADRHRVAGAARSKLGGLTGDVFGAVVELTMAATLVALVLVSG